MRSLCLRIVKTQFRVSGLALIVGWGFGADSPRCQTGRRRAGNAASTAAAARTDASQGRILRLCQALQHRHQGESEMRLLRAMEDAKLFEDWVTIGEGKATTLFAEDELEQI